MYFSCNHRPTGDQTQAHGLRHSPCLAPARQQPIAEGSWSPQHSWDRGAVPSHGTPGGWTTVSICPRPPQHPRHGGSHGATRKCEPCRMYCLVPFGSLRCAPYTVRRRVTRSGMSTYSSGGYTLVCTPGQCMGAGDLWAGNGVFQLRSAQADSCRQSTSGLLGTCRVIAIFRPRFLGK